MNPGDSKSSRGGLNHASNVTPVVTRRHYTLQISSLFLISRSNPVLTLPLMSLHPCACAPISSSVPIFPWRKERVSCERYLDGGIVDCLFVEMLNSFPRILVFSKPNKSKFVFAVPVSFFLHKHSYCLANRPEKPL